MNKKAQNNDFKFSRKISKEFEPIQILDIDRHSSSDYDGISLKTTTSSNITEGSRYSPESGTTSHNLIRNTHMRLRSKCRCTINPFDLSSDCGDDDFLDNRYSLRKSTSTLSSITNSSNDPISSSFDLESICWSEIDQFSSKNNKNFYEFIGLEEDEKHSNAYLGGIRINKRSLEGDVDFIDINRKMPKLTFNYEFRQRHPRGAQNLLNKPSPLPIMRDSSSNHVYIPEISNQTVADLLIGRYSCYLTEFVIIDCRFPYEYEGGHIADSINVYTCHQLLKYLIGSSQLDMDQELDQCLKLIDLSNLSSSFDNKAFIFYCEFSSFRGPKLAQCLRGLDRLANTPFHPRLKIPNVYILHGGYMEFFGKYPQLCSPKGYISMKQTRYALRSPNNPSSFISPSKHSASPTIESDYCSKVVGPESTDTIIHVDETTRTLYRKQQINCQRQLKSDAKRFSDIVATFTKNSDIIRLFKFDEIF